MKTVKVIVAAYNTNGEPDFFFVIVRCTQEEYDNGDHYVVAEEKAIREGYTPRISYDEFDTAGKALLPLFVWESASKVSV